MKMLRKCAVAASSLLASLVIVAHTLPGALASEWTDDETKIVEKLGDWATKFAQESGKVSPFTKALADIADTFAGTLETVTDKTLIKPEWLDKLDADKQAMNQTTPPVPAPLNAPGSYKKMVGDITGPSTYQSGAEELSKLNKVGKDRADTISEMKKNRDSLKTVAAQYKKDAALGHKLGDAYDKLLKENPYIDMAFAFTGVNGYFSLTVVAWEAEVEPALDDRATAAEKAISRYETAIDAAEGDLKAFDTLKSSFRRMYGMDAAAIDTQNLNPSSVDLNPGAVGKLLEEARTNASRSQAVAQQLEKEAADIAKTNSGLSRIQQFTNLMRSAGAVADATTKSPPATTDKPNTTINNNTTIYFKVVPGEFLQQERRGQTIIQPAPNKSGDVEILPQK